jgi:hypothetical protein
MEKIETTCDGCGSVIGEAPRVMMKKYVLHGGGGAFHFCQLLCLDLWRARERERLAYLALLWKEWKEKHTTEENGMVSTTLPDEGTHKEWEKRAENWSMTQFPVGKEALGG